MVLMAMVPMASSAANLLHDAKRAAEAAKLRYTSSDEPGIVRTRRGRGFSYVDSRGKHVNGSQLARIRSLAIPPAWSDVWICSSPHGHLQATGRDARGRKQYRYHPRWRVVRDIAKYDHVVAFGQALPGLRAQLQRDQRRGGLPKDKVVALLIDVMQNTCLRVGNDCYADQNHSFGLTTLQDRHARIERGRVRFRFKGKGGKLRDVTLSDPRIARIVKRCRDIPGQRLFQYERGHGRYGAVTSSDVNQYLQRTTGHAFSAKDFRTWGASVLAAGVLHRSEPCRSAAHGRRAVKAAIEEVAAELGNTVAICRKSYVHPALIDAFMEGTLHPLLDRAKQTARRRPISGLTLEEAALLDFLGAASTPNSAAAAAA